MKYEDFFIQIRDGWIEVDDCPRVPLTPPFDRKEGVGRLRRLDSELNSVISGKSTEGDRDSLQQLQEALGSELFECLFAGKIAARLSERRTAARAASEETGLRLRLSFDPKDDALKLLATLPWEVLHGPVGTDEESFLGRRGGYSICRHLGPRSSRLCPLELAGPLRVLLVDSEPQDLPTLDLEREIERINDATEPAFGIKFARCAPDLESIYSRLRHGPFHVLHFMGHAGFDAATGEGALSFVNAEGKKEPIEADMLAEHFQDHSQLRLVVLNACYTGVLPGRIGQQPYSSVAPALFKVGVPAVVAMKFRISDDAAIRFSPAFYASLVRNHSIDAAMIAGRLAVYGKNYSPEWATPSLFLQGGDGKLFGKKGVLHLGIRTDVTRNTRFWIPRMEEEAERVLDLDEYFQDRYIRDDVSWNNTIFPELHTFFNPAREEGRSLRLEFATHPSIAFAAGFILAGSSGSPIKLVQRGEAKTVDWHAEDDELPEGALWHFKNEPLVTDRQDTDRGDDLAIAISISQSILLDVKKYLSASKLPVGQLTHASLPADPSALGVRNGAHAYSLAQQLANRIKSVERGKCLHIFSCSPNAFYFYLGQRLEDVGSVQLYEYDRPARSYRPSFRFPVLGPDGNPAVEYGDSPLACTRIPRESE